MKRSKVGVFYKKNRGTEMIITLSKIKQIYLDWYNSDEDEDIGSAIALYKIGELLFGEK